MVSVAAEAMTPPDAWTFDPQHQWWTRGPWRVLDLSEHGPASVPRLEVWRHESDGRRTRVIGRHETWAEVEEVCGGHTLGDDRGDEKRSDGACPAQAVLRGGA